MRCAFEYAIVRVVPDVARQEFINAGAIVFCPKREFLGARIALDVPRLLALAPDADVETITRHLEAIPEICRGGEGAAGLDGLDRRERFRWLVSTRSTVIQTSPAHGGVDDSPETALERLLSTMVVRRA